MTNTEIIIDTLKVRGMTDDQIQQLLTVYKGDLPFHTLPEWSRRGYHVKADAAPLFSCYLWKHTSKPSRAAIEAAQEAGEKTPENSPHFYKKLSNIYSFAQVEKNAPAPDLATIRARFGNLPGLVLKVKGEKTGAPNVCFTGIVEKYADEIKAAGGIWSKKKAAYWIKPSAVPAPVQSRPAIFPPFRLALPAPARLPALPAPKANPEPAPAPVPGPWKKCSFYTIRKEKGDTKPTAHKADGIPPPLVQVQPPGIWAGTHGPQNPKHKTEVRKMAAVEREIPGTFSKVPGGYAQEIDKRTTLFVPDMCAASFIPETGELRGYAPDYDALEAAKSPAVEADKPGEYAYYYEMDHAPTGCDFSAELAYYGKHYFLRPLRDSLPRLHGRGITYDEQRNTYQVTLRAYEKIKEKYKIKREMCFD